MYRVGVCNEDETVCAELESMIRNYLKKRYLQARVSVWHSGKDVCDYLNQGYDLDLLFLEAASGRFSGIEAGRYIRDNLNNRRLQIVYTSADRSCVMDVFKTQPMDFLVQPIGEDVLGAVLDLGFRLTQTNAQFEFQSNRNRYFIPYEEILYFVSEARKIKIICAGGEREFYGKLSELQGRLPPDFLTIHQSYIVNRNCIVRYAYESVEMADGNILPISRIHRKRLRKMLHR